MPKAPFSSLELSVWAHALNLSLLCNFFVLSLLPVVVRETLATVVTDAEAIVDAVLMDEAVMVVLAEDDEVVVAGGAVEVTAVTDKLNFLSELT